MEVLKSPRIKFIFWGLVVVFLINDLILAVNNLQSQVPILGLRLAGQMVGVRTATQIKDLIYQDTRQVGPTKLAYQDKEIVVNPSEIGLMVNPGQLSSRLLAAGRSGPWWSRLVTQEKALLGFLDEPLGGTINPALLKIKILAVQEVIEQDALPPRPDFLGNPEATLPAASGVKVDVPKLGLAISRNVFLPGTKTISVPTRSAALHREYTESDLLPLRLQAKGILKKTVSLNAAGLTFALTPDDLRKLLVVTERPDSKNPKRYVLVLRLDDRALNGRLGEFASRVEDRTHAEFNYQYARVALYAQVFGRSSGPVVVASGTPSPAAVRKVLGVSVPSGRKLVYLTFDDGPNPTYHSLILDVLSTYGARATFFLIGQNAQKYPEMTKRTLALGHTINNHSLTHPFLPNLAPATILSEMSETNTILRPMSSGQPVRLFRPPYGGTNNFVTQDAKSLGMIMYLWDVDPRDWSEPETDELVRRVVSYTTNGSIVLLHSNHLATVRALPKILQSLKSAGFEFGLL